MKGFWEKAEKIALFLMVATIPTQLGKHFWPNWSLVAGIRVDYLSPTIYLVDILWIGLVGIKLLRTVKLLQLIKIWKIISFQNILIGAFVLVNVLIAENKGMAVYSWIRVFQWVWFYKYCRNNKLEIKKILMAVIPWWIAGESLLGLSQMAKGGSLNGIWWWLGERRFDFTTIGIAQMSVWGQGLVRSYGTFSHPNSLAGFLMVCLGLWIGLNPSTLRASPPDKGDLKIWKIWWWMVAWLAVLGILLSGSRTIWFLTLLVMIFGFVKIIKRIDVKKIIGYLVVVLGLFLLVLEMVNVNYQTKDFLGGWDNNGLTKRVGLNMVAIKMWRENLMVGVGAGNFISRLPEYQLNSQFYWLQPVHNVFLLIGSEVGMVGLIMIVWWFGDLWTGVGIKKKWWLLAIVLVSGMVDHYWITLPQNRWLLAIVLGIL